MKKLIICMTAALLALAMCIGVLAESASEPAAELYDSMVNLLFNTSNVTLKGTAEFTLDGEWFKTAEGTWQQDGDRAFRQLLLKAPGKNGTEKKNGYTIFVSGDDYNLIEEFTPSVYTTGATAGRNSILRKSVGAEKFISLGKMLASQANTLLGENVITKTADGYSIKLDGNLPYFADTALNMFAQFAANRYFGMDYDKISAGAQYSMQSFRTVTESLVYCMRSVSLKKAEVNVTNDANGAVKHIEGTIAIDVNTAADGVKLLEVSFSADVTDQGNTMVKKFDPNAYNVVPAYTYDSNNPAEIGSKWESSYEGSPMFFEDMDLNDAQKTAVGALSFMGGNKDGITAMGFYQLDDRSVVMIDCTDCRTRQFVILDDGRVVNAKTEPAEWEDAYEAYNENPVTNAETDRQVKEYLKGFMQKYCPERADAVDSLEMSWIYQTDDVVYANYCEPAEKAVMEEGAKDLIFTLQISPEIRIESYSGM